MNSKDQCDAQRPENYNAVAVAYDALATEMILSCLGSFASSIQWCDQFTELGQSTQDKLRKIDEQIRQFTELEFSLEPERLRRLLAIFFDCYLGFQQHQRTDEVDVYRSLIREPWQRRFRKFKAYQPTGRKLLCTYSGGIDFSMRLNTYWMSRVIEKVAYAEGKTSQYLIRELGEFLQALDNLQYVQIPTYVLEDTIECINAAGKDEEKAKHLAGKLAESLQKRNMPGDIQTPTDLLKAVLGYIKLTSSGLDWTSKADLCNDAIEELWDMIDLMNEIVQTAGGRRSLGGAAVTGAQALGTLGETNVHLLVPFVPDSLLNLLDEDLKVLWYDAGPDVKVIELPKSEVLGLEIAKQPETRNFVIEFSPGSSIVYCAFCGGSATPRRADRLVARNRYAYYLADGRVDRGATQQNATQLKVNGLFGFDSSIADSLSADDRAKLARQAAGNGYDILLVSGLQSLDRTVHETTEQELKLFDEQGTRIHIEVSGDKNLDWLSKVIVEYIHSVGVGEELDLLFEAVKEARLGAESGVEKKLEELRFESLEADVQAQPRGFRKVILALEVVRVLELERFYVHDVDIDIIVRKGRLSEEERFNEIRADLIAKWVVLRKLMSRGQISQSQARDTMTQVKEEGMTALLETARTLLEKLALDTPGNSELSLALYGAYSPDYDRTIILVPVRWVYGAIQDQLRVIGAGDTTSIISAVQAI